MRVIAAFKADNSKEFEFYYGNLEHDHPCGFSIVDVVVFSFVSSLLESQSVLMSHLAELGESPEDSSCAQWDCVVEGSIPMVTFVNPQNLLIFECSSMAAMVLDARVLDARRGEVP